MSRCLYCYQLLKKDQSDFHPACSKKLFGQLSPPELPYIEAQMEDLALQVVRSQVTITGAQPKISLHITANRNKQEPKRFTIVGLWGGYILKPPTAQYAQWAEVEDVTMHLASIAKMDVVPHSLIRLQSGNLAYITKRIDRTVKGKIHMEDMCQLTEKLTEDKYQGSYEQIGKAIIKYSTNPILDVVNFFEGVLFSFLTGNADMHLKNFSLIRQPGVGPVLSPFYDMVSTLIVNPADDEDLGLTLNGKKKKIKYHDFIAAFTTLKLEPKQQEMIFRKMEKAKQPWMEFIDISFLSTDYKETYKQIIRERFDRLSL
jgi:serine/threonine-protein kinase HipA